MPLDGHIDIAISIFEISNHGQTKYEMHKTAVNIQNDLWRFDWGNLIL